MDSFYKQKIKENNEIVKTLSGEYLIFAKDFIKKIRKYAMKTIQTENELNKILSEMVNAHNAKVRFTTYVNSNKEEFVNLSKEKFIKGYNKQNFSKKEILGISLFLFILIAISVLNIYLRQPVLFDAPKNIYIENDIVYFEEVKYASKYQIVCIDTNNKEMFEKTIIDNTSEVGILSFNLLNESLEDGTYIIKIKTLGNDLCETSKWSKEVKYLKITN